MAGTQSNFELWPIFHSIYLIPALYLRPGLNSVAFFFFTYIVKFSAFKLVSFMAYTYNIQGWPDGTRHQPLSAPPHDSPTSFTWSTFNLISINYDNLWFHTLNVLEGWMWIGKKIYSILSVTCHGLRNFPPLITCPCIHSWIFETLWVIIFWVSHS